MLIKSCEKFDETTKQRTDPIQNAFRDMSGEKPEPVTVIVCPPNADPAEGKMLSTNERYRKDGLQLAPTSRAYPRGYFTVSSFRPASPIPTTHTRCVALLSLTLQRELPIIMSGLPSLYGRLVPDSIKTVPTITTRELTLTILGAAAEDTRILQGESS
jgi:hypothetical protein